MMCRATMDCNAVKVTTGLAYASTRKNQRSQHLKSNSQTTGQTMEPNSQTISVKPTPSQAFAQPEATTVGTLFQEAAAPSKPFFIYWAPPAMIKGGYHAKIFWRVMGRGSVALLPDELGGTSDGPSQGNCHVPRALGAAARGGV